MPYFLACIEAQNMNCLTYDESELLIKRILAAAILITAVAIIFILIIQANRKK